VYSPVHDVQGSGANGEAEMVRVTVMLPLLIVRWLDELRLDSHTSRGNQVRIILADRIRRDREQRVAP
jgi:hypothetical protein